MPDRYVLTLHTSVASNTGGPFTATWDRVVVPSTGTLRSAWAVSPSITSNTAQNTVDIYRQADAPAVGSNTATTILVSPITLVNNRDAVGGSIRASNDRVTAGDVLELRTNLSNVGSQPGFAPLVATVEVERD